MAFSYPNTAQLGRSPKGVRLMSKTKFPRLIHVTRHFDRVNSDSWLQFHEGGVYDIERDGEDVAIYKLIRKGKVSIAKRFVGKDVR